MWVLEQYTNTLKILYYGLIYYYFDFDFNFDFDTLQCYLDGVPLIRDDGRRDKALIA